MLVYLRFFICKWRPALLLNVLRCLDGDTYESEISDKNNKVVIILKKEISVSNSLWQKYLFK